MKRMHDCLTHRNLSSTRHTPSQLHDDKTLWNVSALSVLHTLLIFIFIGLDLHLITGDLRVRIATHVTLCRGGGGGGWRRSSTCRGGIGTRGNVKTARPTVWVLLTVAVWWAYLQFVQHEPVLGVACGHHQILQLSTTGLSVITHTSKLLL